MTELPGQDSQDEKDETARTGLPGKDNQERTAMKG
jgi:hypothetical protein